MKKAPATESVKALTPHAADAGPSDPLAAFDDIAKGADRLAPTMREIGRDERTGERLLVVDILQADKDACVRLSFAASTELRATFEDQNGGVLAETKSKSGALGERGPVCVRKGGTLRARFEGDGAIKVRFITWSSP